MSLGRNTRITRPKYGVKLVQLQLSGPERAVLQASPTSTTPHMSIPKMQRMGLDLQVPPMELTVESFLAEPKDKITFDVHHE